MNLDNCGTELDSSIIALRKSLNYCKAYRECYWQIGKNAKELKKKNLGAFSGLCQHAFRDALVIKTHNIFHKHQGWETHSIPHIIKLLETSHLIDKRSLEENAKKLRISVSPSAYEDDKKFIEKICKGLNLKRPTESNNESLKRIALIRNKVIAHHEAIEIQNTNLPSLEEFEKLHNWVENFLELIRSGFFPNTSVYDDNEIYIRELGYLLK